MKDATDFFLAFGMLTTGSINTIVTKLADSVCQRNHENQPLLFDANDPTAAPFWGPAGSTPPYVFTDKDCGGVECGGLEQYHCISFNHPFVQAAFMFMGEILCGIAFIALRLLDKGEAMPYFNPLYLAVAGLCDMTATSMMYVGLTMTYASTFQILRGFVVVTTAVFSQFVLKRQQQRFHWAGVVLVVIGTMIVGAAPFVPTPFGTKGGGPSQGASNAPLGNTIIVLAQVVVGIQMCWEEHYVTEYNIPALLVVGWEGFFGLFAITLLITIVHQAHDFSPSPHLNTTLWKSAAADSAGSHSYLAPSPSPDPLWGGGDSNTVYWFGEDDAFNQFGLGAPNNPKIVAAMCCMLFSIAFFNFFGISVTKKMSAAHRMVLDSVRTCVVWAAGLTFFGETFSILQLIGFVILICGTLVYNVIFRLPNFDYSTYDAPQEENPVIQNRKDLNRAITERDYIRADKIQKDLLMLGDRAYAPRGGNVAPLNLPLLTPGVRGSVNNPS